MTPAPDGKLAWGDMQQYKHAFRPFAFVNALNSDYSLLEQSHSFSHAWTHKIWSDLWVSYHITGLVCTCLWFYENVCSGSHPVRNAVVPDVYWVNS